MDGGFVRRKSAMATFDRNIFFFLPADDFVCEQNSLHFGIPDVVAALIFHHLEEGQKWDVENHQ